MLISIGGSIIFSHINVGTNIISVKESYAAGLQNGGVDDGAPGERVHYRVGYYGAYIRDPDGNKIHIVYRGDLISLTID